MANFEDLNDKTVFTKAASRSEAVKMKDSVKEISSQKNVVIFYENQYFLYIMPGQDPYQLRKEIESFIKNPSKEEKSVTETKTTNTKTKRGIFKK